MVGYARDEDGHSYPIRLNNGTTTDLGTLGGDDGYANAVSADGSVVVGLADSADGSRHAFRWIAGNMTDLGTLGGNFSYANAVSADGSVVVGGQNIRTVTPMLFVGSPVA